MWRYIFRHNRVAVLAALDRYEAGLERFRAAIEADDSDALTDIMSRANAARDYFLALNAGASYVRARQQEKDSVSQTAEHSSQLQFQLQPGGRLPGRSEEHTSELQSLMRISYAVFCLKTNNATITTPERHTM